MKNELNSRQWALYNHLKERGDNWVSQWQICCSVEEYACLDCGGKDKFHDSPARHTLTNDIRAINKSNVIQKIILSSPKGIKLASESDFDIYIRSQYAALWRRKERLDKIAKKGRKDGQMKMVFGAERDTVKSFLDSDKAIGERLKSARLKAGLTAAEVVWQMQLKGFDAPMLSKIEKGYCLPNRRTLARLSAIYGISTEILFMEQIVTETETNENNGLQGR